MRKKLKPDLNLEEIQQSVIDEVTGLYKFNLSMRKISEKLSISPMKIRKILITAGVYTSKMQADINELYRNGYNIEEIANTFHMSKSNVYSYLPYETVIYNMKERSVNADKQARYRERKKNNISVEKPEIIKPVIERRTKGVMYIVINQGLRKYLPKDFYDTTHDPLERYVEYAGGVKDPECNIWNADAVVTGKGKNKKVAIAMENACSGFRIVMDIPDDFFNQDGTQCRNLLKDIILDAIIDRFNCFDIPKGNIENYINNNSRDFVFVKAKQTYPSINVSEFVIELQNKITNCDISFKDIFSLEFNRTNRKFGYLREYRDVDMATYHMLGLTEDQTMEILKTRWNKILSK